MQAPSQDFVQEGASLRHAQGSPTKNTKLLGFAPLFTGEFCNFIFVFAIILFYYSIPVMGRGTLYPLFCVTAAGRINSGKIHYGMIPAINTPY